jgi:hypothetical protein
MKLDRARFDEDLPKLLHAIERLGRSLEAMRGEAKRWPDHSLRDHRTVVLDDKITFVESWQKSVADVMQSKNYQGWDLRDALADMRAISRVMDLDEDWSVHAPEFSAAKTTVFEFAKPLDNALREGLVAGPFTVESLSE